MKTLNFQFTETNYESHYVDIYIFLGEEHTIYTRRVFESLQLLATWIGLLWTMSYIFGFLYSYLVAGQVEEQLMKHYFYSNDSAETTRTKRGRVMTEQSTNAVSKAQWLSSAKHLQSGSFLSRLLVYTKLSSLLKYLPNSCCQKEQRILRLQKKAASRV